MPFAVTHALILILLHYLPNTSATKNGGGGVTVIGGSSNSNCTTIGKDCCVIGIDCDHILTPNVNGHTDYFKVTGDDYAGKRNRMAIRNFMVIRMVSLDYTV